jgi:hypothetical protein
MMTEKRFLLRQEDIDLALNRIRELNGPTMHECKSVMHLQAFATALILSGAEILSVIGGERFVAEQLEVIADELIGVAVKKERR